jgi:sugar phosphate isomerase/epimerase
MAFSGSINRGLSNVRRRDLLVAAATSGLAALLLKKPGWASLLAEGAQAVTQWPVTCRDVMLKQTEQPDCWAAMAAYGVDGVESDIGDDLRLPSLYYGDRVFSVADAQSRQELMAALDAAKKRITAFCMHNRFEERPEFELEWCTKVATIAKEMGVPAIRIDVVPRRMPRDEFLPFAVNLLRKIVDATDATGVKFAIENHGNTTNDPAFLDAVFEGVASPRLGLTLDTGNFYWFGHPLSRLYEIYERFAGRAFHTHCKSIAYPPEMRDKERPMGWEYQKYHCPIDQGDIDFAKVIAILRKAGYSNDLCIENEGLGRLNAEQAIQTVRKEVQMLRNLQSAITQDGRFLPVARA